MGNPPSLREIIARNIFEIRIRKGMSQKELALRLGLGKSGNTYISEIERAKVGISVEQQAKLAKALGVPISELSKGIDPDEERVVLRCTSIEWELIDDFRKLPESMQTAVCNLVKAASR